MSVVRLRTLVSFDEDLAERAGVTCQLFAVLADGTEHLLLADRGFAWRSSPAPASHWHGMTAEDLKQDARACVGPDEPRDGESEAQASYMHWSGLADDLRVRRGVTATASQLGQAPHDVVFGDDVKRRLTGPV